MGVLVLMVHYARQVHVRDILRQCCLVPYSLISPLERSGDAHGNFCELMEGLGNDWCKPRVLAVREMKLRG